MENGIGRVLWPACQVPEKRDGHPQAAPGHRATTQQRGRARQAPPPPPWSCPGQQTAGPWTGHRPPLGPSTPPAAPGPRLCPLLGWGLCSRHPPSTRAGASLHLRHSCTQGALPTCTPRPFSQKPVQGPRSTHCPPRAPASTRVSQLIWGGRVPRAPCLPPPRLSPSTVPSRRAGACPHPVPSEIQTRQDVTAARRESAGPWGPRVPEQSGAWVRGWLGTSRRPRPHCPPGGLGDPCRAPPPLSWLPSHSKESGPHSRV